MIPRINLMYIQIILSPITESFFDTTFKKYFLYIIVLSIGGLYSISVTVPQQEEAREERGEIIKRRELLFHERRSYLFIYPARPPAYSS